MSNTTHRKRLARRFAAESGRSYASAVQVVRRAAEAGALPDNLDEPGMQTALAFLMSGTPVASTPDAVQHGNSDAAFVDRAKAADAAEARRKAARRWTDPDFLATCAPGDPLNMLTVASNLAKAPLVETWWHPTDADRMRNATDRLLVRRPKGTLTEGGDLVLVDADRETSEETFGWEDDAEKAARHRIHPDGLGVTFFTPLGEPQRTHRALFTDEPLTSMAQIQALNNLPDESEAAAEKEPAETAANEPSGGATHEGDKSTSWRFAHEGNDVPRCTGTSWRDKPRKRDGWLQFGPGGFNRCVKAEGHAPEDGGDDPFHVDEWGNMFRLHPNFRVVRALTSDETAQVAREAGIHVSDHFDFEWNDRFPQNSLWMIPGGTMVQISNHYPDRNQVSAQVVYPIPPRTTVRFYPYRETAKWKKPTTAQVRKYERAWGWED